MHCVPLGIVTKFRFEKVEKKTQDFRHSTTMTKRFLKFLRDWHCLMEIGVRSQASGPLYLSEFLTMSRLYLGSTKRLPFLKL